MKPKFMIIELKITLTDKYRTWYSDSNSVEISHELKLPTGVVVIPELRDIARALKDAAIMEWFEKFSEENGKSME